MIPKTLNQLVSSDAHYIMYDGDCPLCKRYVQFVRLKEAIGQVELVNLREHLELSRDIESQGYKLDKGMLLVLDKQVYYGGECLNKLALLTTPSNLINKLNAAIFRHQGLSKVLYPVLRCGRATLLKLLGRKRFSDVL